MDVADPARMCAKLLHYVGPDVDDIFNTLDVPAPTDYEWLQSLP